MRILPGKSVAIFTVTYFTALANATNHQLPAATGRIQADIAAVLRFFSASSRARRSE